MSLLSRYALHPSKWMTEPLEAALPDDDDVYTEVSLHDTQDVRVVELTEGIIRPVYDGGDIYGNSHDNSMKLRGGLKDGKVYGVESLVRGLESANRTVQAYSEGDMQLVFVELLRTPERQGFGHEKATLQMLEAAGIKQPDAGQVWKYGKEGGKIFSYVRPEKNETYAKLFRQLSTDAKLLSMLRDAAKLSSADPVDDVLSEYIGISASMKLGDIGNAGLSLPASHMVHGGAAGDFFIADRKGRILSIVPFDYPDARLAAYRFTETDANYQVLLDEIATKPLLQEHFKKLGYSNPLAFPFSDWLLFQRANRMQVRVIIAMGGTTYLHERWHFELGTMWLDLLTGRMYIDAMASQFPFSGGTGLTAIKCGREGSAVWHTRVTRKALERQGLLAA